MTNIRGVRRTTLQGMLLFAVAAMAVGVAQAQQTTPSNQNNPGGTASGQPQDSNQVGQQPSQQAGQQTTQQAGQQSGQPMATDAIGAKFEAAAQGHRGLRVQSVDPNSPAAQAGLQVNDQILSADGRPFRHPRHLVAYLSAQAGRPVPLVVDRNGRQSTIELMPQQTQGDHGWLGVLLQEVAPNNTNATNGQTNRNGQQAQPNAQPNNGSNANGANAQNNEPGKGAEVAEIAPEGPAARAGLRPGDVILQANGKEIDDAAELVADIHEMKPQTKVEFTILRNNQEQKIAVTLGNRSEEYAEGQGQQGQGQFGPGQFGGPFPGQYPPRQFPGPNGQFAGGQEFGNGAQMHQQMMEQNQRIEQELRQLREEIKQLREQIQKK